MKRNAQVLGRVFGLVAVLLTVGMAAAAEPRLVKGVTEPGWDALMNSPVDGIISKILFEEGDKVERGDIMMELDKTLQELELARREVVLENRRREYERMSALFDRTKGVSEEELDKKRLEYREAEAEHALAKELLEKRLIRAPFAGTLVDFLNRAPGEGVKQNEAPLLRLVDTSQIRFVCRLEESDGRVFQIGEPIRLKLGSDQLVEGKVCYVSAVVDPASGLMTLKVLIDNADGRIRPGVAGVLELQP